MDSVINFYNWCNNLANDDKRVWYPFLQELEVKAGVKKVYLLFGFMLCIAGYLIFGYGAQLLCNFIGFAYPAYQSMIAIESPQTRDDTKWLTYWTTYALFSLIEYPSDLLLFWCPFYWLLKCLFLVWLFAPIEYNGSVVIYRSIVRPFFLRHQADVDTSLGHLADHASNLIKEVKGIIKTD